MSMGFFLTLTDLSYTGKRQLSLQTRSTIIKEISKLLEDGENINETNLLDYFEFNITVDDYNFFFDYTTDDYLWFNCGGHDAKSFHMFLENYLLGCYDQVVESNIITKFSKVTFNKSGSKSTSGRVTIPSDFLRLMGVDEFSRDIEISYCHGSIIIKRFECDLNK